MKVFLPRFFLIAFLCLFFTGIKLYAQPAGWNYVQGFSVTENSGTPIGKYQLRMVIDTQTPISAGEMNVSGNDIRFGRDCNGTSFLNYWIESGINTPTTVIWVQLDTLPASSTMPLYMYYGNASATGTSSINGTFWGPNSGTDSVNNVNLSSAGDCQRGFRFATTEDVLVTAFGRFEPNGTSRYLTLFDVATQNILRQETVGGPANQFTYGNLSSPIWLTEGTQYLMEMFTANGQNYYFGASPQMGQHMIYYDMRYCNGCTQNTYPLNTLAGMHYGYPDFWYYTKTNITPAPSYTPGIVSNLPANVSMCRYDTILLESGYHAMNPVTFTWAPSTGLSSTTDSSVYAFPAATTTYSLTIDDGCTTPFTDTVMVIVNNLPTVFAGNSFGVCTGDSAVLESSGTASVYAWNNGITDSVYFTPSGTLDYILTGTDTLTGCANTDTMTLTVNPLPAVYAGPDQLLCRQDMATFTATGADTYVWSGGMTNGVPFLITSVGNFTYSVTGTDANGCTNSDALNVVVNDIPEVYAGENFVICPGTPVVLSASGNFTVSWNNGVMNGVSFYPDSTASYILTGTDANNCSGHDTVTITVITCVGIENEAGILANIYPNPTSGALSITTQNVISDIQVEILDMSGRMWITRSFAKGGNIVLDMGTLAGGMYTVKLTADGKTSSYRIVLKKD